MVLLDDPRPKGKKVLSKRRRYVRLILRALMVLLFLSGASLWMLSVLGGNSPTLKQGAEQLFTQVSGMRTEIADFENLSFFPDFQLQAGGVRFYDGDTVKAKIQSIDFSMPFWSMLFSTGKYETIALKGIEAAAGTWTPRDMSLSFLGLHAGTDEAGSSFIMEGQYGADKIPLSVKLSLARVSGKGGRAYYTVMDEVAPFTAQIGTLALKGRFERQRARRIIHIDSLVAGADEVLTGTVTLKKERKAMHLFADLTVRESRFAPDIRIGEEGVTGALVWPVLFLEDGAAFSALVDNIAALAAPDQTEGEKSSKPFGWGDKPFAITWRMDELKAHDKDVGHVGGTIEGDADKLDFQIKKGSVFSGGDLSGDLTFQKSDDSKVEFESALRLKNWHYGTLMEAYQGRSAITGTADVRVKLASAGVTTDDLLSGLEGKALLIAGQGTMKSQAFNIWGGGLVNAMLPSLDPEADATLNCMIADFDVTGGVATAKNMLIDTGRVTVLGEGRIDLPQDKISLVLEPKAKEVALLDMATAVKISGPIFSPSVGPEAFSLLKKIGGTVLGTINPAFFALSLTDLGMTEDHPCRQFIGAPPEKAEENALLPEQEDHNE